MTSEAPSFATIVAYNQAHVIEIVRDWTPQQLLDHLHAGHYDALLSADEIGELATLLHDWTRRALGMVTLRDAILVDTQRGARVYDLVCQALTVGRCAVPPEIAHVLQLLGRSGQMMAAEQLGGIRLAIATSAAGGGQAADADSADAALASLLDQAEAQNLALVWYAGPTAHYPLPPNLDNLLPQPPPPYQEAPLYYEPPTGRRRALAIALVLLGMGWFAIPLLSGYLPPHPAGPPLALLTLGLLVGIRAGWPGYAGSFCIWLIPNLPGFHYGTPFATLPAMIPLLLMGLVLLASDRYVRALWRWLVLHVAHRE